MTRKDLDFKTIYNDYKANMTLKQLGIKYNCHYVTIYNLLKKNNVLRKPKNIRLRGYVAYMKKGEKIRRSHSVYCNIYNLDKVPEGYIIHHKDKNTSNDNINNLELLSIKKHNQLHNKKYNYKKILKAFKNGVTKKNISNFYGCSICCINRIIRGEVKSF